jgi:hypothetical protein
MSFLHPAPPLPPFPPSPPQFQVGPILPDFILIENNPKTCRDILILLSILKHCISVTHLRFDSIVHIQKIRFLNSFSFCLWRREKYYFRGHVVCSHYTELFFANKNSID